jgi:hypothetical protein
MSVFAITGVRMNTRTQRVTDVRWAQVNPKSNEWMTEPAIAPLIDVVDAIQGGDDVWTIFHVGVHTVLGPKVKTVVYAGGLEGIETIPQDGHPERTLDALPQV